MLGNRVTDLAASRVLVDGRSLFGRRGDGGGNGDDAGGAGGGDGRDRYSALVIHGASTNARAVRQRVLLGRLVLVGLAVDSLLMGYDYWTRPPAALHTVAFTLAILAAGTGAWALVRHQLVLLHFAQCTYAVQFIVGLLMISAPVQIARLSLMVLLYFALETYRDESEHRWFVPYL